MVSESSFSSSIRPLGAVNGWGLFWLLVATVSAGFYFSNGLRALLEAWQLPEYSHGPLIPVLSALLFLRHMREVPVDPGPKNDRWPGVALVVVSLLFGGLGILSGIDDIVAYALILWIGGMLLISWGWRIGWRFWPGVVHLALMLPLPGVIYYKTTTYLQFVSSELGVWFLRLLSVPVFLDGNIIDLGVTRLHVAEACSGLRYMFPILSFSYIFAVLYQGPAWHKMVLLLSAAPIAIVMNSIRIAAAGIIVQQFGNEWLDGFTHFFEGWVIFVSCVVILFLLAWLLLFLHPERPSLTEALDLDISGVMPQFARLQYVRASGAMVSAAVAGLIALGALASLPDRGGVAPERDPFSLFPRDFGEWRQAGPRELLTEGVAQSLGADDYHQVTLTSLAAAAPVGLFMAWYEDQSQGGVHSPEICLPGGGWEIAWLERTDVTAQLGSDTPFHLNRAIIQQGEARMMVYYWFQQKDRRIAWDFAAKYWLMVDGIITGRTDGALVRLITAIRPGESDAEAEARLQDVLEEINPALPRFIPEG
ncbi:VPLPA-CTERM-specific exosortase XrtD [Rhodosalinus sp. 5P4]|uniref:VPLPA-CTERM-specific exosortase XrtD n=1 Tax=Rhodosalinus sp. 5P4 TaxID=3239196 RepID=UPI003525CBCE